jgi:sec-independent protein translocase protein TatC
MPDVPEHTQPLDDQEDPESFRQTLVEHLDELRSRIVRSLLVLCVAWGIGWFTEPWLYQEVNNILRDPALVPEGVRVEEAFRNFSDPFFLRFKLSFVIGLIIASPIIILQLWGFIRPALKPAERKPLKVVAPLSAALFLVGGFFGFLIVRPALFWFFSFLSSFEGVGLIQEPGLFVMFVLKMLLAFGIGFQLPVVLWFLGQLGIVTSQALTKNWRFAVAGIALASGFLTPGGDFFSFAAMSVPLALLYFAGIGALRISERRKAKRAAAELTA